MAVRVLLVSPFFSYDDVTDDYDLRRVLSKGQYVVPPLGLGYISSYVRKHLANVEVEIFDAHADAVAHIRRTGQVDGDVLWNRVETRVRDFHPEVVGISGLFEVIGPSVHKLAALAKRVAPRATTVIGGVYAQHHGKAALADPNVDFAIQGEGEEAFRQLLEHLLDSRAVEEVDGLIWRTATGEVRVNRASDLLDVDSVPWPDRRHLDMDTYATASRNVCDKFHPDRALRAAHVLSSRGCRQRCTFCSTRTIWGPLRNRSPRDVVDEIKMLVETYEANVIFFNDDNMSANKKVYKEVLRLIIKECPGLGLHCSGFQVSSLDEEALTLSVEAGMMSFNMAFESGDAETLRRLRKPLTPRIAEEFVRMARRVAPSAYISGAWIVGLPFETKAGVQTTYDFARRLDLDWSYFSTYQPYRGTPLYDECVEKGYIKEAGEVYGVICIKSPVVSTDDFTKEWIGQTAYETNLELNFLCNRNAFGSGDIQRGIRDFLDMATVYPTHVFAHYCLHKCYRKLGQTELADKYLTNARHASKTDSFYAPFVEHFKLDL